MKPSLYGLKNSNRNFSDPYYWGKNQFNSSFPAALACYMRDQGIPAVYLCMGKGSSLEIGEAGFSGVFGSEAPNERLFFSFESRYEPFKEFVNDELEKIDLVVCDGEKRHLAPLEVKLTTLPDSGTAGKDESQYGSEIVVRSATTRYMALMMAMNLKENYPEIREIFEPCCGKIRQWENADEMKNKRAGIFEALDAFFVAFSGSQRPVLMQPVWKTKGMKPELAEHCLDVFVWSDFALTRLFMDSAKASVESEKITRFQRAALRLARFLHEVSRGGAVYQAPIYDGMTYDTQNDKEFAVSGAKTNPLMACPRLREPAIRKDEIKNIILGGGQKFLSPERRLDAILHYSTDLFES